MLDLFVINALGLSLSLIANQTNQMFLQFHISGFFLSIETIKPMPIDKVLFNCSSNKSNLIYDSKLNDFISNKH